jgi:thioredoxin-related protein
MIPIHHCRARRDAAALAAALMLAGLVPASATKAVAADAAGRDSAEVSVAVPVEDPALVWLSYREAKSTSRHSERPLMIYFSEARSMDCGRLDRDVWTDRKVRRYLNDQLVVARVDMQDMPAVAGHFDVKEAPTLLFLASDGERLVVLRGYNGADSILRVAEYVCTKAYEFTDYETWKSRNPGP